MGFEGRCNEPSNLISEMNKRVCGLRKFGKHEHKRPLTNSLTEKAAVRSDQNKLR